MKIGEARVTYNMQIKSYHERQCQLYKQRQELDEKIKKTENGSEIYKDEAALLELQYNALDEKRQEYQDYMDKLMRQWTMEVDKVSSKQQADSMKESSQMLGKILLTARRIMHGDKVPDKDEKMLMEYDSNLYQIAKFAGMLAEIEKRKEHKSLWDDEKKRESQDAIETADNTEAFSDGPQVVDVDVTIEAATSGVQDIEIDFEV